MGYTPGMEEREITLIDWLALVSEETPDVAASRAVFRRMLHELAEEQPYERGDETPRSWPLPGYTGTLPSIANANLLDIGIVGGATDDFQAMEEWLDENEAVAQGMKAPWLALVRSKNDSHAYVMLWDGQGKHVSRFVRGTVDVSMSGAWTLEAFLDFDNREELVQQMELHLVKLRAEVHSQHLDEQLPGARPGRAPRF